MSYRNGIEPHGLDEKAFDPRMIHPLAREANARLLRVLETKPPLSSMSAEAHRALERAGGSPFAASIDTSDVECIRIDGNVGKIPIRVFRSHCCKGVYLHFHGGGWVLGGASMQDEQLSRLARGAKITVLSVDYRLAPEHPYPAAPDDCERTALWLLDNGARMFGTTSFCMGGESAGAHLAMVTALRLRNQNRISGYQGLNLVSGLYNLTCRQLQPGSDIGDQDLQWFLDQFCLESLRHEPDVSPIKANPRGLPPTLFTTGSLDPLIDESAAMYTRFLASGVTAKIAVWPGGMHAFASIPGVLFDATQQHQAEFLRNCIGNAGAPATCL